MHNLHAYAWGRHTAEPIDYENGLGTEALLAVPTPDHYLPLLYVLGAQRDGESVHIAIDGIEIKSIGMLSLWVDGVQSAPV